MTCFRRPLGLVLLCALWVGLAAPAQAQVIPINEARDQGEGATVTVEGTVARAFGDFVRFQDDSGPTGASGLVVRQTSGAFFDDIQDGTITQGTQLQVTGTLSDFNGLLQINNEDLSDYTVQGQGSAPAPQSVSLSTLASNGENYESELVTLSGLSVQGATGTFDNRTSYTVADDTGTLTLRVQTDDETQLGGTEIPGGTFDYTGVVGEFRGEPQLIPIFESDLQVATSFRFTRQFARAQEGGGPVQVSVRAFDTGGATVSVTARVGDASTAVNGTDVTGFSSPQTLTFSGADPAPQTLTFNAASDADDTEGVERLEVVLASQDGGIASPGRFTLWVLDDAQGQGLIAEGDSGDVLIDQLQATFNDPPTIGLDRARDSLYAAIYNDQGFVEGVYSGFRVPVNPNAEDPSADAFDQGLNAEHLWPQSKGAGTEPALSDLFILAPARAEVNSARCNYPYAEIDDAETERWFRDDAVQTSPPPMDERDAYSEVVGSDCGNPSPNGRFEPRESFKGNVARAVFYFVTVYPSRADLAFYEAQKDDLLAWHRQDPVDATEMRRNLIQASFQGNVLNPFVVDSTLADRAYGSGGGTPGGDAIPIADARNQGTGAAVTIEGTVTRAFGAYARLQDESGPTGASGLVIRQTFGGLSDAFQQDIEEGTIQPGTRVRVSGTISAFSGLFQINGNDLNGYEVIAQGAPPAPQNVTLADLQAPDGENYESELVRVTGLSFPEASGTFSGETTYTVAGANGTTFEFRVQDSDETNLIGASIPTGTFTYEGVVGQFNGGFQGADEPDEGYQFIPIQPETALPVELTSFDAVRDGAAVTLTWQTASETNNAGFRVEHHADASPTVGWTEVGFVESRADGGTTTEAQSYRFRVQENLAPGTHQFRLTQVDLDGTTHRSDPVRVEVQMDEALRLTPPAPNPATERATVSFAVRESQEATIALYNVLGQKVATLYRGTPAAAQTREVQINTAPLSSGLYIVRLQSGDQMRTERLTVVR